MAARTPQRSGAVPPKSRFRLGAECSLDGRYRLSAPPMPCGGRVGAAHLPGLVPGRHSPTRAESASGTRAGATMRTNRFEVRTESGPVAGARVVQRLPGGVAFFEACRPYRLDCVFRVAAVRAGQQERIDHPSLTDRRGIRTETGEKNRAISRANAEVIDLAARRGQIEAARRQALTEVEENERSENAREAIQLDVKAAQLRELLQRSTLAQLTTNAATTQSIP